MEQVKHIRLFQLFKENLAPATLQGSPKILLCKEKYHQKGCRFGCCCRRCSSLPTRPCCSVTEAFLCGCHTDRQQIAGLPPPEPSVSGCSDPFSAPPPLCSPAAQWGLGDYRRRHLYLLGYFFPIRMAAATARTCAASWK